MDRHTLVVIIVTAAVTTTVTAVVGWMLNFFKLQIATTLITRAKTSAGKTVIKLMLYGLMMAVNAWDLLRHLNAPGLPSRYDVLWIILTLFGTCVWFVAIVSVFMGILIGKKMAKYETA